MKKIEALIVVDAAGASSINSLKDNVYMVDTNRWLGSWNEASNDLHTVCEDKQLISWNIVSISPANAVSIKGFSGDMVNQGICTPTFIGISGDGFWEGRIETRGNSGRYTYVVEVLIDGKSLTFSAYLDVQ